MHNICRLCLTTHDNLIFIFEQKDSTIRVLIEKLCFIKLRKDDSLPKCICAPCQEKLYSIQKFIKLCKASNKKLHEIYQSQSEINVNTSLNIISQASNFNTTDTSIYQNRRNVSNCDSIKQISEINFAKTENNNKTNNFLHSLPATNKILNIKNSKELSESELWSTKSKIIMSKETKDLKSSADEYNTTITAEKYEMQYNNVNTEQNLNSSAKLENNFHLNERKGKVINSVKVNINLSSEKSHKASKYVPERSDIEYLCDICKKKLTSKSGLRLHLKIHSGLKPFKCKICDKGFVIESYKKRHELTHFGDKPYVCYFCSATFASVNGFKYHLMTHTKETNFSCNICKKSFIRYKYLKEHIFTHTGEKPYICNLCGVAYGNSGSLFAHKKKCNFQASKLKTTEQLNFKPVSKQIVPNVYRNVSDIKGRVILVRNSIT